jgi:hypothetical protein
VEGFDRPKRLAIDKLVVHIHASDSPERYRPVEAGCSRLKDARTEIVWNAVPAGRQNR